MVRSRGIGLGSALRYNIRIADDDRALSARNSATSSSPPAGRAWCCGTIGGEEVGRHSGLTRSGKSEMRRKRKHRELSIPGSRASPPE